MACVYHTASIALVCVAWRGLHCVLAILLHPASDLIKDGSED